MSAIRPLLREFSLWYFRRALKEICPMHADVPFLVHRINALTFERNQR